MTGNVQVNDSLYTQKVCREKCNRNVTVLPRVAVIEILHENPQFEIVKRHFSKLACTPSFESHVTDNKQIRKLCQYDAVYRKFHFFVSYWWSDLTARQSAPNGNKSFTTMIFSGRYTLMSSAASTFHFRRVMMRGHSGRSYPENVKQTAKLEQIYSQHFALINNKTKNRE